jgi:hypothetical protein
VASVPPAGAAGGFGDAERDRLTLVLREHYAVGRLDEAELDRRVGIVLSADHAAAAADALAGLPPLGAAAPGAGSGTPAGGQAVGRRRGSRRRHAQVTAADPAWVPTGERFRDPSSGAIMRVWLDPVDGSRHYVPDDAG